MRSSVKLVDLRSHLFSNSLSAWLHFGSSLVRHMARAGRFCFCDLSFYLTRAISGISPEGTWWLPHCQVSLDPRPNWPCASLAEPLTKGCTSCKQRVVRKLAPSLLPSDPLFKAMAFQQVNCFLIFRNPPPLLCEASKRTILEGWVQE